MVQRALLSLILIFAANASVEARSHQAVTVDQMTCQQAVAYVKQYKMYYMQTYDGAIPMYPIIPLGQNPDVKLKEAVDFHIVQTRDQARCLIGYTTRVAN